MRTQIFAALACGVLLSANAAADAWDKKTILTVDQSILVPGATLQPGKYVMKLAESQANRYIVRILNEQEDQVITTVLAIPNWRLKPTGDTQFVFWETPAGNPPALRAWFYPGDNFGQEFAYPKGLAAKIATKATEPVPAFTAEEPAEAELATAPVTTIETPKPAREPEVVAQAAKPPEPTPTPAPEPATMPATGSFGPAILMAGLASTALGYSLRVIARKH
jgi:hypothetical protein